MDYENSLNLFQSSSEDQICDLNPEITVEHLNQVRPNQFNLFRFKSKILKTITNEGQEAIGIKTKND